MRPIIFLVPLIVLLGACDRWWGDKDDPPLPGKRISVLLHQRALAPDPKLAGEEILLPAPFVNSEWPQPGGYPNHAMHHIDINEFLDFAWSTDVGTGSDEEERFVGSPVVADGKVFVMDAQTRVGAFDAENGRRLWQVELTPDDEDDGHISGGVAYNKGRVYATTGFAQVIALDAETGAEIWRRSFGAPVRSAPTVRGGRVFVLSLDNKLNVLRASNGETLWTHSGLTETASLLGASSPAVDSGVVVVPYSSGELVALKVENGRVLWTDSLSSTRRVGGSTVLSHIRGLPVIDRGRVFALSYGGVMVSIDLRTGQRIWDKQIGGLSTPWVAGDYIFVLTRDSEVVSLSRKDGRIHWVQVLPRFEDEEDKEDPITWTGPILAGDRLIIAGTNGQVVAVSPYTGDYLGRVELSDGVSVAPVIANRRLYFMTDDAELVAYQ
ncbi:MAG: PQQ-binding-like beta-propeller repeat protein [Rhodospirillales bacterium]